MKGETFSEYIANTFFSWLQLNQIDLSLILFMEGHKNHLALHLSNFYAEKNYNIDCFASNVTHTMQPCNVSLFRVMKLKQLVHEKKIKSHKAITFVKMFEVIRSISSKCISFSIRHYGLYPFNPDGVDYS